jgi:hypothetical protein
VQVVDVDGLSAPSPSARTTMRVASTLSTTPGRLATTHTPESRATALDARADERRVVTRSGTAWRCMLAPMSARLASSCSRKGTSAAATDTIWFGDTSISSICRRHDLELAVEPGR